MKFKITQSHLAIAICIAASVAITAVSVLYINGFYAARANGWKQWAVTEVYRNKHLQPLDVPCDPSTDLRTSDLCAQWKAADAARDSADWSLWALIVGTTVNIGTLLFVGATFRETRKSTSAALDAARAAERSFNGDRAWVFAEAGEVKYMPADIFDLDIAHDIVQAKFKVENFGATPALSVEIKREVSVHDYGSDEDPTFREVPGTLKFATFANRKMEETSVWVMNGEGEALRNSTHRCFVRLTVKYYDVFSPNEVRQYEHIYELFVDREGPDDYVGWLSEKDFPKIS